MSTPATNSLMTSPRAPGSYLRDDAASNPNFNLDVFNKMKMELYPATAELSEARLQDLVKQLLQSVYNMLKTDANAQGALANIQSLNTKIKDTEARLVVLKDDLVESLEKESDIGITTLHIGKITEVKSHLAVLKSDMAKADPEDHHRAEHAKLVQHHNVLLNCFTSLQQHTKDIIRDEVIAAFKATGSFEYNPVRSGALPTFTHMSVLPAFKLPSGASTICNRQSSGSIDLTNSSSYEGPLDNGGSMLADTGSGFSMQTQPFPDQFQTSSVQLHGPGTQNSAQVPQSQGSFLQFQTQSSQSVERMGGQPAPVTPAPKKRGRGKATPKVVKLDEWDVQPSVPIIPAALKRGHSEAVTDLDAESDDPPLKKANTTGPSQRTNYRKINKRKERVAKWYAAGLDKKYGGDPPLGWNTEYKLPDDWRSGTELPKGWQYFSGHPAWKEYPEDHPEVIENRNKVKTASEHYAMNPSERPATFLPGQDLPALERFVQAPETGEWKSYGGSTRPKPVVANTETAAYVSPYPLMASTQVKPTEEPPKKTITSFSSTNAQDGPATPLRSEPFNVNQEFEESFGAENSQEFEEISSQATAESNLFINADTIPSSDNNFGQGFAPLNWDDEDFDLTPFVYRPDADLMAPYNDKDFLSFDDNNVYNNQTPTNDATIGPDVGEGSGECLVPLDPYDIDTQLRNGLCEFLGIDVSTDLEGQRLLF